MSPVLALALAFGCADKPDAPDTRSPVETAEPASDTAADTGPGPQDTAKPDSAVETGGETAAPVDSSVEDTALTTPDDGLFAIDGERPKNVLMISLDTTRRDWFARFGGPAETPNLDALFDGGVLLSEHRSCSNWTWASMACAQTSRSESQLGWVADGSSLQQGPPRTVVMADDVLRALDWRTLLVSSNPFLSDAADLATDFDVEQALHGADAATITAAAIELMDDLADGGDDRPWYLHVHYFDPHSPYAPPEEYLDALASLTPIPYDLATEEGHSHMVRDYLSQPASRQELIRDHLRARYTGEVRYADAQIGALLARAESSGLLDDTLVVFFTDHGEQIWEHGESGHDNDIYEEENRSVVSFIAPGLAPAVWEGPTIHQDIWPTALSILDVSPEPDFTGVVVGERDPVVTRLGNRFLRDDTMQMVERDELKLIYRWTGEKELYNLSVDPSEQNNLYDPEDPDVLALWELLLPEVEAIDALVSETPVNPGP